MNTRSQLHASLDRDADALAAVRLVLNATPLDESVGAVWVNVAVLARVADLAEQALLAFHAPKPEPVARGYLFSVGIDEQGDECAKLSFPSTDDARAAARLMFQDVELHASTLFQIEPGRGVASNANDEGLEP